MGKPIREVCEDARARQLGCSRNTEALQRRSRSPAPCGRNRRQRKRRCGAETTATWRVEVQTPARHRRLHRRFLLRRAAACRGGGWCSASGTSTPRSRTRRRPGFGRCAHGPRDQRRRPESARYHSRTPRAVLRTSSGATSSHERDRRPRSKVGRLARGSLKRTTVKAVGDRQRSRTGTSRHS